jgi:hypothetical protein
MTKVKCPRCAGTGNVPSFAHVQNGLCFRCKGTGLSYPDKPQPENLELVSNIFTLVKIEGNMTYFAQFYVWDKEPRASMFGKGRFFSNAVVRGERWSEPVLKAEPQIFEAPLDVIRGKYKEYLGKGYTVLTDEDFHAWYEANVEYFADRG